MYRKVRWLKLLALAFIIIHSFFEIPPWCVDHKGIKDVSFTQPNDKMTYCDNDIYPNSGIPKLNRIVSGVLEILALIVINFFMFFRRTFRIPTRASRFREYFVTSLVVVSIVDIIFSLAFTHG